MIKSLFASKEIPFVILEPKEFQIFAYVGDQVHVIIQNYETKEFISKCGKTGNHHLNNVVINNNAISNFCLKCWNITEDKKKEIVDNRRIEIC